MTVVYTAARTPIRLAGLLARGGEAAVYHVQARADTLAKIYTRARPEAQEKLSFMRASPPADPSRAHGHASIAWPQELLFDHERRFIGYLMPYLRDAVPIIEVFNPRRRARVLPGFSLAYLHRTARNLASALAALHARGYVVGDLNERNILVTPRALVTLIDTDSFQVEQPGQGRIITYPCPVGRLEYTPPELQGQAFHGLRRDTEHDCFGLGVLVFQLLLAGNHPFRSQWLGEGEPPPVETKIAQGLFAWSPLAAELVAPPPGVPDPMAIHPAARSLILRCFVDGHYQPRLRPSAEEWADALLVAEQALVYCKNDHCFSNHLKRCPVCNAKPERETMPREAAPPPRQSTPPPAAATAGWARAPTAGSLVRPGAALGTGMMGTGMIDRVRAGLGFGGTNGWGGAGGRGGVFVPGAAGGRTAIPGGSAAMRPVYPAAGTGTAARPAKASARWLRQALSWAAILALAGAGVAAAAGALVAAVFESLLGLPVPYAGTPAGLWAAVVGGVALTAASFFRGLEQATDYRFSLRLIRWSLIRGGASLAGWAAGWMLAGEIIALLGVTPPAPTAFALAFGARPTEALAGAVGWTLAWVVYGAIGGALGSLLGERPTRWAAVGAVFGAAGWLAVHVAASLWVGA